MTTMAGWRRALSRGGRRWASGLVAVSGILLGVAPLVSAAPTAPAPAPPTFFGVPIPSSIASAIPQLPYAIPGTVPGVPGTQDPINMQVLAQILGAKPNGCGPNEVAPGEYVKLDCRPYAQVLNAARDVFDPAMLERLSRGEFPAIPGFPGIPGFPSTPGLPESPTPAQPGGQGGIAAAVDHRTMALEGPIKDQGLVGNCSAFSLSSVIDNAILRLHRADVISPLHLWSHYGNSDMGTAGDSNLHKAIALNQTWPYSARQACELVRDPSDECGQLLGVTPGSSANDATLQAQFRQAEQSGAYRITSIERITSRSSVNVEAIVAVLATGADVWAGFDIDAASWKNMSHVNGVIRDWATPNSGHAVALAGYRQTPGGTGRQFLVHNSWGNRWGDHGFAWVSESMVRQHLQVAYRVNVAPA